MKVFMDGSDGGFLVSRADGGDIPKSHLTSIGYGDEYKEFVIEMEKIMDDIRNNENITEYVESYNRRQPSENKVKISDYKSPTGISYQNFSPSPLDRLIAINRARTRIKTPQDIMKTRRMKALFEQSNMFNPDSHRKYFITPTEDVYHYWKMTKNYDPSKLKLVTVENEEESNITLSTETVNYLKEQDQRYVQSMVRAKYWLSQNEQAIASYPEYKKGSTSWKRLIKLNAQIKQHMNDINNKFKRFVADFSESLIDLNKPFFYDDGNGKGVPSKVGEFSAIELDKMLNSIFGDVTNDGDGLQFVPAVNRRIYNNKQETECCLKLCVAPTVYRKKGVKYEDSEDYKEDMKEYEAYKNSPDFLTYEEKPKGFKVVNPDNFFNEIEKFSNYVNDIGGDYLNEAKKFMNSPIMYVFNQLTPYLNQAVSEYAWFSDFKIEKNEILFEFDLTKI